MARMHNTAGKTFSALAAAIMLSATPASAYEDRADAPMPHREEAVQMATLFAPKALPAPARPSPARKATYIRQGLPMLAPFAHIRFCVQNPEECEASTAPLVSLAAGTVGSIDQARQVNEFVNETIEPRPDAARPTGDVWTLAPAAGDCDDYAVTKRSLLIKAGWPSSSVLLAHVVTRQGVDHLVTIIRTDDGDFVLDNLDPAVRPVHETRYRWVSVQSADNPRFWHRAEPQRHQLLLARL